MKAHRRPPRLLGVATALIALSVTPIASADGGLALDRFNPAPAGDRFFGVPSPAIIGDLTPHGMLIGDYAHNPLVLKRVGDGDDGGGIVTDQLVLHLNATLALAGRIGINVDLPAALLQSGDNPSPDPAETFSSPSSAQIGDLRFGARVRLAGEVFDPIQLAIGGYLWLPTGAGDSGTYVGDGAVRGLPYLVLGGRGGRFLWSAMAGIEIRPSQNYFGVAQGAMFQSGAAAAVLLGEERNLQVGPELTFATVLEDANRTNVNSELLLGARYRFLSAFEVGLGAGPGITSGIGTPRFRAAAMLGYSPEPKRAPADRDNDGILDTADACPDVPGERSDDPPKNGCPLASSPPDRDKDTILDAKDACPDAPGLASSDPAKNGCPPPPDRDRDSILDAVDACPDTPGIASDQAPKNGCPPDKDDDRVADSADACPSIPGEPTSDPATNGCPGDSDKDGIRNDQDSCPREKGKADPDPQKNGCPQSVRVTDGEIVILQQVQFDTDRATIKPVSGPLLDEVAQALKDHPEILTIEVQGHTDNRGQEKYNEKLSQSRAEAVVNDLIGRGIEARRMTAKGYGSKIPIADNRTEAGRRTNRRVQFKITGKSPDEQQNSSTRKGSEQ